MEHKKKEHPAKHHYLSGKRVLPKPIRKDSTIEAVIDGMDAYNGGRRSNVRCGYRFCREL